MSLYPESYIRKILINQSVHLYKFRVYVVYIYTVCMLCIYIHCVGDEC